MGAISRKVDTAMVMKGWWDGSGKRSKIPVVKRKNQSRPEQMYVLGYQAAIERKSYGQTMDEYRDYLHQEAMDEKRKAEEVIERSDIAQLKQEAEEEGDAVLDAVVDLEESQDEGADPLQQEVEEQEGDDLTLMEETRIEEYDLDHDMMLLAEEEDEG